MSTDAGPKGLCSMAVLQASSRCCCMTWVLSELLQARTATRRSCAHCPPANVCPSASRTCKGNPAHVQVVEAQVRATTRKQRCV
eukprot:4051912-Lingulodinium_polyedra.AAC.1